jgi:DNA-binding PucR family transcriptional regulator
VVGPTVPLSRLPGSLRMARIALRLKRSGVIVDDPVFLDEHLDALIVHQDGPLLSALENQVLQPLTGLPAMTRRRLEETLGSWLRHMGDRGAVAEELHIHRQTVRYRLAQLQELFGDAMTDPARRLQLTLALGWRAVPQPDLEPGAVTAPPTPMVDLQSLAQRRPS